MSTANTAPDPYRLFFPLGLALGFAGLIIWPLAHFGIITGYWGISHAFLQSNGFLFCFISGFLLTALPRFTGTENPTWPSQILLALCITAGSVTIELQSYKLAQTLYFAAYVIFVVLIAKRFLKRDRQPPDTFALIGYGVLAGAIGAFFNMLTAFEFAPYGLPTAGKRLLTEGMTLLLVLGVGGFLGPRLLGFDKMNVIQIAGLPQPANQLIPHRTLYAVSGLIIFISIIMEHMAQLEWMNPLRALVATVVIAITLEPWRLPLAKTTLARSVWLANIMTIVGLWLAALVPAYRVDMLHVLFIG
ncbi:MAG TPA: NnrS family protein, partial [Candidatus Kapabacteria bacterium]|nr:NnrS family protein [Candidatus Kapabacteria bacterium]